MARIRSIHPGLFTDEAYMSLSLAAKVALPGIWTECDDQGVFEWKPLVLKARIFPADNVDMVGILAELEAANCFKRFTEGPKPYAVIRNFRKWQRPEKPKIVHVLPDDLREYAGLATEEDDKALALRKLKFAEAGGKCVYCAIEVTYYSKRHNSMEIDHKIPRARGGSDDPENLCCACRTCNRAKCDMTSEEFIANLSQRETNATGGARSAKPIVANANPRTTPQRKEEGGKMKGKEEGESEKDARATVSEPEKADPPHWQPVQAIIENRAKDVDDWELDFLHSVKWAPSLTKPQADKLKGIQDRLGAKATATAAIPKRYPVEEGTPAWAELTKRMGKRPPVTDIRLNGKLCRGWYSDTPITDSEAA